MSNRVLLVEDDGTIRFGVARSLERHGFVVTEAESCRVARERFHQFEPDAVVTDYRLPDGEALDLIADFRRERPSLPIFVMTGYGSIELAVRAVKIGADNFLTKPVDMARLAGELHRACSRVTSIAAPPTATAIRPESEPPRAAPLGRSAKMRALEDEVERLKDAECSLLILGETGTGKTLLARRVHETGRRRDKAFVDLNCAGLAPELVESELFGHERGSFTSAHATKEGVFELADGGTLFLDEIGDIDVTVQPKVLKAIEEKRFRRIGSVRERSVDIRFIAATHRNLRAAVQNNSFRADLYYRLGAVTLTVPPLRERSAEIPDLARSLLGSLSSRIGRSAPDLTRDAEALLVGYAWPGNVRELKNVLERALHLAPPSAAALGAADLRLDEDAPVDRPSAPTLHEVQRAHIERALAVHGHVGEAARSLGISRSSMYSRLKEYGLLPARSWVPRARTGSGS